MFIARYWGAVLALVASAPLLMITAPHSASAGDAPHAPDYRVLAPLHQGNLTVFPVVTGISRDTSEFLTLDEGIHSGEVVVSEAGSIRALIRNHSHPIPAGGPRVNQLVLVNNSDRPLLLLAGEIV